MALTHRYVAIYPSGAADPISDDPQEDAGASYSATYTTMSSMESSESGDLTTGDGTQLHVEIIESDGSWSGSPDTTAAIFDGWTCDRDSSQFIKVTAYGGARSSDGLWDTTAYILENNSSPAAIIEVDNDFSVGNYLEIDFYYLQASQTQSGEQGLRIRSSSYAKEVSFYGCYSKMASGGFSAFIDQLVDATNHTVNLINCIATSGADAIKKSGACLAINVINCTVFGVSGDAIESDGTDMEVVNCAVFNNTDDWQDAFPSGYPNYCGSDDGGGTNPVNISPGATEADDWNDAFTDYSTGDVTIKDTDSVLYHAGQNATADSRVPSIDIAGTSRPTGSNAVSIGAFEWSGVSDITVSISETLALVENISMAMEALATLSISISDSVGVSEYRAMSMPLGSLLISDGIGAGETLGESMPLSTITGIENLTVIEVLTLLKDLVPSVFENIGVVEFLQILKDSAGIEISASESIGLAENIDAIMDGVRMSIADNVAVTEFIDSALRILASRAESVSVVEAVTVILHLLRSAAEQIAVTEDIQIAIEGILSGISKSESVALIESISLVLESIIGEISESELIGISESVSMALESAGISIADGIGVLEAITAILPLSLTIADLVGVSEYILINLEAAISVTEAFSLTENIQIYFDNIVLSRIDNLTVSEYLNISVSGIVGIVTAKIALSRPSAQFTFSGPSGNFTLQ